MATKEIKFVDGWSESCWVSLAVKALRLGWPVGLEEAAKRLGKNRMKQTLLVQVFEDIFPAPQELSAILDEIRRLDYRALCRRDTCHNLPGIIEAAKDVVLEWVHGKRKREDHQERLWAEARKYGIWLLPRALSEFDGWLAVKDQIPAGRVRAIDETTWSGMPAACVDQHTVEGRWKRAGSTLLSGTEEQHLRIGRIVQEQGWRALREPVHASHIEPAHHMPTSPKAKVQNVLFEV